MLRRLSHCYRLNSWHAYLPGYDWEDYLKDQVEKNFKGGNHLYYDGFKQENQPFLNSECGNVWGYRGSTGDVDWSYDYHRMMNSFRKFPEVAGWLYTEPVSYTHLRAHET